MVPTSMHGRPDIWLVLLQKKKTHINLLGFIKPWICQVVSAYLWVIFTLCLCLLYTSSSYIYGFFRKGNRPIILGTTVHGANLVLVVIATRFFGAWCWSSFACTYYVSWSCSFKKFIQLSCQSPPFAPAWRVMRLQIQLFLWMVGSLVICCDAVSWQHFPMV